MATQRSLDEAYMACARAIAALSHAERKKVGAIIVSGGDGHGIIAEGYNGTPGGFDNVCEVPDPFHSLHPNYDATSFYCGVCDKKFDHPQQHVALVTKPEVLHAESNAIAKVAKSTNSSRGATLYVTYSPCFECSKLIIQAGIRRVVYDEEYRLLDGIDLLRRANIEVVKL
jgi:dCMP deaminase